MLALKMVKEINNYFILHIFFSFFMIKDHTKDVKIKHFLVNVWEGGDIGLVN